MRNGKLRGLLITVMLLVFIAGLASILYPYIWGAAVDNSIANTAKAFLDREEPELPTTTVIIDSVEPEKVKPYPELWEDMVRYNQSIAAQGQAGLSCAYEKNGQHLEVIIRNMVRVLFLRPKERPYRTNNFYAVLARQNQLDKEVYRIVHPSQKARTEKSGAGRYLKGKAHR